MQCVWEACAMRSVNIHRGVEAGCWLIAAQRSRKVEGNRKMERRGD